MFLKDYFVRVLLIFYNILRLFGEVRVAFSFLSFVVVGSCGYFVRVFDRRVGRGIVGRVEMIRGKVLKGLLLFFKTENRRFRV